MWWEQSEPGNFAPVPWMPQKTIDIFGKYLENWMTVLEHGGGGSTLWLAERVAHVTTHEGNVDWYNALAARAPDNVTLRHTEDPPEVPPRFDLVLIDGGREARPHWMRVAHTLVKPGGVVVVDNYNRPEWDSPFEVLRRRAEKVELVNGNIVIKEQEQSLFFMTAFLRMPE